MNYKFFIIACLVTQAYAMEQSEQLDLVKLQLEKGLVRVGFARLLGNIHSYEENSLVGGFSGNAPYRCKVNNTNYVVRTFKDNALEVREIKVDINRLVGEKKIGPQIHYYAHHDDFSYIIMDFIDTSTLSLDQASRQIILECVAKQARAIADFDPNMVTHHKENILQETLRHYETLKNKNVALFEPLLQELKIKVDTVHQKIEQENRPMVINHNDFYTRNMFFHDKDIVVIDWETLGLSYEFSDLACYSVCTCLDTVKDLYLLTEYLKRNPTASDQRYFDLVKLLMRILVVVGPLNHANYVPENLSKTYIFNDFKDYATAFAEDARNDSPEFLYHFGMSQLEELREDYNKKI